MDAIVFDHLRIAEKDAWWSGTRLELTPIEFNILRVLARRAPNTVTRTVLLGEVYAERGKTGERKLDVHICNLRRKLRATRLRIPVAERESGYRLERVGARVLIVDDEEGMVRALRRILNIVLPDSECVSSDNFDDAIAREISEGFDLCIVDLHIRGRRNGLALAAELRKYCRNVILISGDLDPELNTIATDQDLPFLHKPFAAKSLELLVRGSLVIQPLKPKFLDGA